MILLIGPIPFVPPTHVIVIHPAPRALSVVEFALIDIPIAVDLNPIPRIHELLRLGLGSDRPENGLGGAGGGGGELEEGERAAEGRKAGEGKVEGDEEGTGEGKCG